MSVTQLLGDGDLSHLGINEDALDPWTQAQLKHAVSFCQSHGWKVYRVDEQQSKILHGLLAIWLVSFISHHKSKTVWIISGDVPTDIIPKGNSENARQATLYFSKKFLRKAQRLRKQARADNLCQKSKIDETNSTEMQLISKNEQDNLSVWIKSAANLLILYHEQTLW